MSTKSSLAYNSGEDGCTDFHLYAECFSDELHLRLRNTKAEIDVGDHNSWVTVHLPDDILDDLVAGIKKHRERLERIQAAEQEEE